MPNKLLDVSAKLRRCFQATLRVFRAASTPSFGCWYHSSLGYENKDMKFIDAWKQRARNLKVETYAIYLACRDPRVPWYARLLAAGVVGYAFSPIDLIPDFIPVLGYLDDLILIPLGITLVLKMIPATVLDECREKARERINKPTNWVAASVIIVIWLLLAGLSIALALRAFGWW
jgi:uncharacterized membrane protein YkvA (DUF1232 family)